MSRLGFLASAMAATSSTKGSRLRGRCRGPHRAACRAAGFEVVLGTEPITSNQVAVAKHAARRPAPRPHHLQLPGVGLPPFFRARGQGHRRAAAVVLQHRPHLPGHGRPAGGGGSLDQIGRRHERLWGDVSDDEA